MQEPFTLTQGIQLAGLALAGITSLLTVWWRMEVRIRSVETQAMAHIQLLLREHQEFKLTVAENYASWDTLKEVEARLSKSIESIGTQVSHLPDVLVDRVMKFMSLNLKQN